jgi:hypothetical protein
MTDVPQPRPDHAAASTGPAGRTVPAGTADEDDEGDELIVTPAIGPLAPVLLLKMPHLCQGAHEAGD